MRLSDAELELLRTRPVQTRLDLFVFQPRVVMKCRLDNASAAKNDRTIPFDSVAFGSYSSVESGMTLLVGTSEGASDVGKIRIVSATSSNFKVSENSDIKWEDALYLTVIRYWDLWPVFPRIIQNPADDTDVIFYKDYDIPYANQNFYLGTFVNAGPHRPILMEAGTGTAYYSSTGTLNLVGSTLSYNWAFEGGNPTGSTSANPGTVNYTTAGDYVTRLIVTDTQNGNTDTTYRYVSVKNKIGEGSVAPIARWEMNSLSGSRDEGGYSVEFTVHDSGIQIDENCLIMLRAEDWYGNTKTSLGGNYPNESNTFFVGYIERGSIRYNAFHNFITFTAVSVTGMMKKMTGFSVSVESKQNPSTWYELRDMDIRRAMYHYLKWHSTVLSVTDFSFIGTDYNIQFFDVDRTSLFDAIDNLMKSALFGRVTADRQGRLWADVDPMAYTDPTGTFVPVMGITNRDWMGQPAIDEVVYDSSSYLELGGIAYSGAFTGSFAAVLSGAPGYTPSFHGNVEKLSGLAVAGQAHINRLSGNIWANRNQRFPSVSMEMSTPTRNLDIAPQEVVSIKVNRQDTVRDEQIEGIFIPSSFGWTYRSDDQILLPRIEFAGVVSGNPGDTILIPPEAEFGDFEFPEFTFPPLPPFYFPILPIITPSSRDNAIVHIKNYGLFYTNNLSSDSPTWSCINANLEPSNIANLRALEVSAAGQVVVQAGGDNVWGSSQPGDVWVKVFDSTDIENVEGLPFTNSYLISAFGINRTDGTIFILAGMSATIFSNRVIYPYLGTIGGVTRTRDTYLKTIFSANVFGYITYGSGKWAFSHATAGTNTPNVTVISSDGTTVLSESGALDSASSSQVHTRSIESTTVLVDKEDTTNVFSYKSVDNGVSFSPITGAFQAYYDGAGSVDKAESVIANGDGSQIIIAASSGALGLVRSLNGGSTWITGAYGSSGTTAVWHMGLNSYIYGDRRGKVWLVDDATTATGSYDKTGNLANLITGSASAVVALRHF